MGTFRQFRQCHSALVAELPNCLPENDLFTLVLRFHATILDSAGSMGKWRFITNKQPSTLVINLFALACRQNKPRLARRLHQRYLRQLRALERRAQVATEDNRRIAQGCAVKVLRPLNMSRQFRKSPASSKNWVILIHRKGLIQLASELGLEFSPRVSPQHMGTQGSKERSVSQRRVPRTAVDSAYSRTYNRRT